MQQLILVRHAEADWSVAGRFMGHADRPLTYAGRAQAKALRNAINRHPAARVVSSDLRRARDTATLTGHDEIQISRAWREIDMGTWSGQRRDAVQQECPADYAAWRARVFTPPAAESWEQFEARVGDALQGLRDGGKSALVFTHSGVVRAIVRLLLGKNLSQAVRHASVTTIKLDAYPELVRLDHAPWAKDLIATTD